MSKIKLFLTFLLLYTAVNTQIFAQKKEAFKLETVVIDPGHGGKTNPGAVYGKILEKDIVLEVALKLGKKIKAKYPAINVVYTRDKDISVPLNVRSKIANKSKGDLFISIHVNSVGNAPNARGVETYTVGMHKNAANLAVAKKENNVITLENGYEQTYVGFDPNDEESYIMFGLGQHAYQNLSLAFSHEVQSMFKKNLPTLDRGMKQAGFLVLWSTSMPSVLTEIGFLSNKQDRAYLTTDKGREMIAKSLYDAFVSYKKSVEIVSQYDTDQNKVYYSVQFLVTKNKQALPEKQYDHIRDNLNVVKSGNIYKYFAGKSKSHKEILSLHRKLKNNGFPDAFIVAFKDEKQISIKEARKHFK